MAKVKKELRYNILNAELEEVLLQLQGGELDIDEALTLYEKGRQLIKELSDYLETAENTIKRLEVAPRKTTKPKL